MERYAYQSVRVFDEACQVNPTRGKCGQRRRSKPGSCDHSSHAYPTIPSPPRSVRCPCSTAAHGSGDLDRPNTVGKWHYLAVVLDLCTQRVVGWALSESRTPIWLSRRWIWLMSNEEDLRACCFTRIKDRSMRFFYFASGCGVIECARA